MFKKACMEIQETLRHLFYAYKFIRSYPLYNNAIYLILNSIVTAFIGLVFWNIVAKFFSPEQVGIGSSLIATSSLIAFFSNMGLGIGLIRYLPEVNDQTEQWINSAIICTGVIALISSIAYIIDIRHWSPTLYFVQENFRLSILFVIFTVMITIANLMDNILVAGRAACYVFLKNFFISLVKLPLPICVFASYSGFGIFAGNGTGFLLGVFLTWFLLLPKVYKGFFPSVIFKKDIIKQILSYSFANHISNFFIVAPQFIYPIMVLNKLGPKMSAFFWITWMVTMIIGVIPTGISQSLLAEGACDYFKLAENSRHALRISIILTVPAVIAIILLSRYILNFFGAEYADNSAVIVPYLALAVIPMCINMIYISINQVKKRVHLIIVQTGISAFFSIALGWVLLSKIGLSGVGISYLLAHLIVALIVVVPLWNTIRDSNH